MATLIMRALRALTVCIWGVHMRVLIVLMTHIWGAHVTALMARAWGACAKASTVLIVHVWGAHLKGACEGVNAIDGIGLRGVHGGINGINCAHLRGIFEGHVLRALRVLRMCIWRACLRDPFKGIDSVHLKAHLRVLRGCVWHVWGQVVSNWGGKETCQTQCLSMGQAWVAESRPQLIPKRPIPRDPAGFKSHNMHYLYFTSSELIHVSLTVPNPIPLAEDSQPTKPSQKANLKSCIRQLHISQLYYFVSH